MNLTQLQSQGLADLYPPLVTRSGVKITTHAATGALGPDGLVVTVKTLFPPSERRRAELVVTEADGGLRVRPIEATGITDAQRFAELLRERWMRDEPTEGAVAPLRLAKNDEGRYAFHVGRTRKEPENKTAPASPAARRATSAAGTEKGDS